MSLRLCSELEVSISWLKVLLLTIVNKVKKETIVTINTIFKGRGVDRWRCLNRIGRRWFAPWFASGRCAGDDGELV
jgi:hypothetical protein